MTNQRKTGALLSYVLLAITNIVGVIYTPFMIRAMGQTEFGLYSLIVATVGYLTVLDFGIGTTSVRYIAKYRAERNKEAEFGLNGMLLIIDILFGMIVLLAGIMLFVNIENLFSATLSFEEVQMARIMTALLIFNLMITFSLGIFRAIITAYEKFIFLNVLSIIRVILTPCIMIPLLLFGHGAVAMVTVTTSLNVASLLITSIYCFLKLKTKFTFNNFDISLLKQIGGFSFFIFLNIVVDQIYWGSGQFILGIFSGTAAVAIFAVAVQIIRYFMNFSTAITGVFLPKLTEMIVQSVPDKDISDMFIRIGRIQYIILGLIMSGFILYGSYFIRLWAGDEFSTAYYMILIIMIPLAAPLIQNLGIVILQAKNLHKVRSLALILISILNIIISVFLSSFLNGFGPAIATAVSLFIGNIVFMNIYYHRKMGLDIHQFWKEIGNITIPIALSLLVGGLVSLVFSINDIMTLVLGIISYTLFYICCMWLIGMNEYEKNLFRKRFSRIKRRDVK